MSKFLVIAEKPSVAQSYAKNLSAYKREDGYLEGESCIVSWCYTIAGSVQSALRPPFCAIFEAVFHEIRR